MERIVTGSFLAIVLVIMFGLILGTYGTYLGVLIADFITGLISNSKISNGLVNGIFVGLFTGIILLLLAFLLTLIYGVSAGLGRFYWEEFKEHGQNFINISICYYINGNSCNGDVNFKIENFYPEISIF